MVDATVRQLEPENSRVTGNVDWPGALITSTMAYALQRGYATQQLRHNRPPDLRPRLLKLAYVSARLDFECLGLAKPVHVHDRDAS
jgi:hypothetical protein